MGQRHQVLSTYSHFPGIAENHLAIFVLAAWMEKIYPNTITNIILITFE